MKRSLKILQIILAAMSMLIVLSASAAAEGVVSFNSATAEELMAIEEIEIPEALAKAIVEYRKANGPFKRPEELQKVPGMTQDFLEDLNPVIKDGDVVYDPDAEPALAPSKC